MSAKTNISAVQVTKRDIHNMIKNIPITRLNKKFEILKNMLVKNYKVAVQSLKFLRKFNGFKVYYLKKWYYMSPTLHKVLIHSTDIINASKLPMAALSEEAQEAMNKSFKRVRENYARRCGRKENIRDVFNFLLINSDPVITRLRKSPKNNINELPQEATQFFVQTCDTSTSDESDIDDDSDFENDDFLL